jgi:hypothetical protein
VRKLLTFWRHYVSYRDDRAQLKDQATQMLHNNLRTKTLKALWKNVIIQDKLRSHLYEKNLFFKRKHLFLLQGAT